MRYGYPLCLALMAMSVGGLLIYYRRKGWLSADSNIGARKSGKRD
jgi:hypothetical protein